MRVDDIKGVKVEIIKSNNNYPLPFGRKYLAKGFYIQGKYVVVVGQIEDKYENTTENTIRMKYPISDVKIELILK